MASLCRDKDGTKRILFMLGGRRKCLRLGKMPVKAAQTMKAHVEALVWAAESGTSPDSDTARWAASLGPDLFRKLAALGLVAARPEADAAAVGLGAFIDAIVAARPNMKPNTRRNYLATRSALVEYFGESRDLRTINPGECDDWTLHQETVGRGPATTGRNVKRARQFFRVAVRKGVIPSNPWQDVKAAQQVNKARECFVDGVTIAKVLEACPDAEWRLIFALARYGGLRTPSETFALTWADVDWAGQRIRVCSPKTAHHPGGEYRIIPLFPELHAPLQEVWDEAPEGAVHVIHKHRIRSGNLRTTAEKIIRRAGVEPWERLFQNLRASRETELCQSFPLHVATAWIGNTAAVAAKHYLQVTEADYAAAVQAGPERGAKSGALPAQKAAQTASATIRHEYQETTQALVAKGLRPIVASGGEIGQMPSVPPRGVEPLSSD